MTLNNNFVRFHSIQLLQVFLKNISAVFQILELRLNVTVRSQLRLVLIFKGVNFKLGRNSAISHSIICHGASFSISLTSQKSIISLKLKVFDALTYFFLFFLFFNCIHLFRQSTPNVSWSVITIEIGLECRCLQKYFHI